MTNIIKNIQDKWYKVNKQKTSQSNAYHHQKIMYYLNSGMKLTVPLYNELEGSYKLSTRISELIQKGAPIKKYGPEGEKGERTYMVYYI